MQKMECTTKTKVLTENGIIQKDGYASIIITNIGTDDIKVNDNIPVPAGSTWGIDNQPYVIIAENTSVRFAGMDPDAKALIQMIYYKEI
jgi:hypothetical protein